MRRIQIVCPICSKSRRIQIPPDVFEIDEGSLLKLPLQGGIVCPHDFIVVIDYNFAIRDYEVPKSAKEFESIQSKLKKGVKIADFSYF
jgi:hypothetical protein